MALGPRSSWATSESRPGPSPRPTNRQGKKEFRVLKPKSFVTHSFPLAGLSRRSTGPRKSCTLRPFPKCPTKGPFLLEPWAEVAPPPLRRPASSPSLWVSGGGCFSSPALRGPQKDGGEVWASEEAKLSLPGAVISPRGSLWREKMLKAESSLRAWVFSSMPPIPLTGTCASSGWSLTPAKAFLWWPSPWDRTQDRLTSEGKEAEAMSLLGRNSPD